MFMYIIIYNQTINNKERKMTHSEAYNLLASETKKSKFTHFTGLIYDLEYKMELGEFVDSKLIEAKKVLGYK